MGQMNDEAKFERIEALLHATAERGNQMELRFNQRMDRVEQRMDREDRRRELAHRRWESRMGKVDERMGDFERKLGATQKLVQYGMKLLVQIGEQQKQTKAELRELAKAQKAWLDSMRGGNGNGHRRMT
jgi:hypothetical protein